MTWVQTQIGLTPTTQSRILWSILGVLGLWLLRRWILRFAMRNVADPKLRYQWGRTANSIFYILVILYLLPLWLGDIANLTTYLGLLSAGLAVALRDPLVNLAGWAFVIWRRPFEVGDRIQIGAHAGDVIDLRIFQFTLMEIGNWVDADQSTGRVIHIPNGKVFTETLANFSKGFQYIWNEIPVLVTFESDWKKAKEILLKIVQERGEHVTEDAERRVKKAAEKFLIFYSVLTPTVYTSVEDSGVLLTIRYLCDPRNRRGSAQVIWEDILEAFGREPDIDFAYPTQRFYTLAQERQRDAPPSLVERDVPG